MNAQKNDIEANDQKSIDENSIMKRHRKHRRGRKNHAATNCGTREPKRPTEAQIEWQPQGKVRIHSSLIYHAHGYIAWPTNLHTDACVPCIVFCAFHISTDRNRNNQIVITI